MIKGSGLGLWIIIMGSGFDFGQINIAVEPRQNV